MAEGSTGLTPEKTDQSYTDDTPQEPEGLCFSWMDDLELEFAILGLDLTEFQQELDRCYQDLRELKPLLERIFPHVPYSHQYFCEPKLFLERIFPHVPHSQTLRMLNSFREGNSPAVPYSQISPSKLDLTIFQQVLDRCCQISPLKWLEEDEPNFEKKWNSVADRSQQDSRVSLLSEEMFNLEIEAMVFLSRRNYSKYLMDEKLGEIKEKFRILTEYVSRISQGRSARCCKIRQLLNDHKRLSSLIGRVCQEYRTPRGKCLPINERIMSQLQQSFNYKSGDGVNADPPELSCSPEPKGSAVAVPSIHNSYQDQFEREWNSLRGSNDSQIGLLSGKILGLEMDTKQLLSNVMVSKNVINEKYLIEETLKRFKFLSQYVPKDFPGCFASGCNKLQSQLLEDCKRLESLIGEVCQRHNFKCNTYDDSIQTSPASSTKDGIEMNPLPENSIDNKPFYGVKADPKGEAILEVPSWHNSNEHNLETAEWNSSLLHYSNDSQTKRLPEHISNLEAEMGNCIDMNDSENILDKRHTQEIQKFHKKPSSSGCNNPQLEPLQNLESFKSHHVINTTEENEVAQCGLSYSTRYAINTVQENEAAQNNQEMSSAAQGDEGGLSCSHHVINITQENEATTQDEGGFSVSRHVINTTRKNVAGQDDQKMSNRCNITIESCSRLILSFVEENIGESVPFFGVQFTLLGALGHPFDLESHDKETSPPLSLKQAFSLFWGPIVWSAMFFLMTIGTAIRIRSLPRRVLSLSMLALCLVYYFAAIASITTEYSVLYNSATTPIASFWIVSGGGALILVLVFLLVIGCCQLFQLIN